MCSLNSVLQLLRHTPEFLVELHLWKDRSPLLQTLNNILTSCGSDIPKSALKLRKELAEAAARPELNSGQQLDTIELFGYLLNFCPNDMFCIQTSFEFRFQVNGRASSCPICGSLPDAAPGSDTLLRLALPKSWTKTSTALTLQTLLDKHFQIQAQGDQRTCSSCLNKLPYFEKLRISTFPNYIIIQLLRMNFINGKTTKNPITVHIPNVVVVDKTQYEVIGTITHQGTAEAGHNRAYLKEGSAWYICEDARHSSQRRPIDSEGE